MRPLGAGRLLWRYPVRTTHSPARKVARPALSHWVGTPCLSPAPRGPSRGRSRFRALRAVGFAGRTRPLAPSPQPRTRETAPFFPF
ncbi:hypothetical protein D516_1628 [Rhodobacter sp. AKP1]|nr:hypothetical protein D516_1628 [Rhodobacter sp. AKP1]